MGLAAIDPHSLKVQTERYKIPKFDDNQALFGCMRNSHLKMYKFTKKCIANPNLSIQLVGRFSERSGEI